MKILILGANGDIGKSIVTKIYNEKSNYLLTYSKQKPKYPQKNIICVKFKFQDESNLKKNLKKLSKFNFDVIINNVGDSNPYKDFLKISDKELKNSFTINFFTPFNIISYFIKKSLRLKKKINIINISSNTIKFFGSRKNFPYFISKTALENSLLYFSKHFTKDNIRINIIRPGLIQTKKSTKLKGYSKINFEKRERLVPLSKSGHPEDVSQLVKFLVEDRSSYIVGQTISVSGGE
jgi:3-oxoacyl-[acyl-carrier protein] reductase